MNCPYCGGTLEKGTLHSRGGEYFLPDGAKLPAWFTRESMEKVGAVGLAWNPALTRREWPEAYCCRELFVCRGSHAPHGFLFALRMKRPPARAWRRW